MSKLMMIGNVIVIPIEYHNGVNPKFVMGSISGVIFPEVYTYEEIIYKFPSLKIVEEGFLGVNEKYYGTPRAIKD